MSSSLKIVMVDRNSLIDRRIILEAESLIAEGHQVELVMEKPKGNAPWVESLSFPVRAFAALPETGTAERETSDLDDVQRFRYRWEKLVGTKPALLLGAILHPSAGKRFAFGANSLVRWQMFLLLSVLELLDLRDGRRAGARIVSSANWLAKAVRSGLMRDYVLDFWEEQVFEYLRGRPFDVIHIHDLPVLPLGYQVKKRLGKKLVYDAHELYAHLPGLSERAQQRLLATERAYISRADGVVLINDQQGEIMKKAYGDFPYVCLTNATKPPVGFDPHVKPNKIREALKLPSDARIVLFQGIVNRQRKIDVLLEGIALATSKPHMVFLTWGEGVEEFSRMARELKIADRVHFLPPVPWNEVIPWAASADAGIMPYQALDLNTTISSPNKMYEFIEAGIPMIGNSDLVNVQATVGGLGLGVVSKLDAPEDYANAIDKLFLSGHDHYNTFVERVHANRHRFSWAEVSKPFLRMYSELKQGAAT